MIAPYVETAADFAFTMFLACVTPGTMSDPEWRLFKFHELRKIA